jgi:glycosyltransferase involved in cell wall biosynthesis
MNAGSRMNKSTIEANDRPLRVLLYAPWFAEYSTRLALALKEYCQVLLILDEGNSANECPLVLPHEHSSRLAILKTRAGVGPAKQVMWVLKEALKFRPDIVHVQETQDLANVYVTRLLSWCRKVILAVHDPAPHSGHDAEFLADRLWRFASLRRSASAYHVHGEYCRGALAAALGHNKPVVSTAHGVLFLPTADMMRDPQPGRVLLFGRMEAYKGVEEFLCAAEILHSRKVPIHLVLAGAGPELERLSDRIQASGCRISIIARYLSPTEVVEQFQLAELVVLPYRDATQSGVLAGAFGNGRPVIATAVGGLADAVRDGVNGLLVTPGDVLALADAVERVMSDSRLRSRLIEGARQSAQGEFSWDAIARRLVARYRSLLA